MEKRRTSARVDGKNSMVKERKGEGEGARGGYVTA